MDQHSTFFGLRTHHLVIALIAIVTPVVYFTFVFTQTIEHRQFFLTDDAQNPALQTPPPSNAMTAVSALLLLVCLAAGVLLAKKLAPSLETAVLRMGAPEAVVGVIIAALIVMFTGWRLADPIIGAGIGLFIVPRTWSLMRQAIHILMEGTPAEIRANETVHDLYLGTAHH